MTPIPKTLALPLAALLAGAVIAGCGDDETASRTTPTTTAGAGPTTVSGPFALVAKPPSGFDELKGTATLVRARAGTDASIELHGLKPNADYMSHLHAGDCDDADPGGPHFKFDAGGPETPPNEIHLPLRSDADGDGAAKAHDDKTVPTGEGRSIVVHTAAAASGSSTTGGHAHPAKIACAQLGDSATSSGAATQTTTTASAGLVIAVRDGKPVGGVQELTVEKGDRVRFTVTADQAEEIHTHGYDIAEDVAPGKPARFDFTASIEGIFEAELEKAGVQILKLTVNP